MGVIVGPQQDRGSLERHLARWLQMRQQNEQHQASLDQNQKQFDAQMGENQRVNTASINDTDTKRDFEMLKADTENFFKTVYQPLVASGQVEQAEAAKAQYAGSSPSKKLMTSLMIQRGRTDLDTAAQNTAQFTADQTGMAAGGSQDAQARNFTFQQATGQQLSGPAFGDQAQRQGSPAAYNQFLEREGGARTTAGQDQQAAIQRAQIESGERQNAAQIESQERMATGRLEAKGAGTLSGGNTHQDERKERVLETINGLVGRVGALTAGVGSLTGRVPGTPARDFKADLDTLKANIAFSELQEMREASKTGGALGSVAIRELELLESSLGGLDQGQSPANLKKNLMNIRESIVRWQNAKSGGPSVGASAGRVINYDANGNRQ